MYWTLLITITGVITLVITAAFGWRVFVAVKGLLREVKRASKILGEASEMMRGVQEMEGVKALRARAQHD